MDEKLNQRLRDLTGRLAADPGTATLAEELQQIAAAIETDGKQAVSADEGGDLLAQAGRLIELGTMAAAVFHEMNQPLLGIKGFAELLQEAVGSDQHEKMASWAQEIRMQVDRVQEMQRKVADFLRPITQPGTLVKLDRALDEALSLFRSRLAKKKIEMGRTVPADLPGLAIRKQHLVQILVNLLSNALDALSQSDRRMLRVAAKANTGSVRVLVTDTGPGISPDIRAKLFEPFQTDKGEAGTGLGLYISRRLAEQYGGSLDLIDPVSLGWKEAPATAFELRVPIALDKATDGDLGAPAQIPDAEPESGPDPKDTRSKLSQMMQAFAKSITVSRRVLVVDDEQVIRHILSELFQGKGLEVDAVGSSEDALKALAKTEYAVVVSDKNLPGMDGLGLLGEIKKRRPRTEVVMITGYASVTSALEAIELGAFDYVPKPFPSLSLVVDKVRGALVRHEFEERVHAMVEFLSKMTKELHKELTGGSANQAEVAGRLRDLLKTYRQEEVGGHVLVLGPPPVVKTTSALGLRTTPVPDLEAAITIMKNADVQVLIYAEAPERPGVADAIQTIQAAAPGVGVFVISQEGSLAKIVEAIGLGVGDYLIHPAEGQDIFGARLKRLVRRQQQVQRYRNLIDALKALNVDLLTYHAKDD